MRNLHRVVIVALLAVTLAWSASAQNLTPDPLSYVSPSRPYASIHLAVDLDLDLEQQTIAGSVTHTLASLRDGLSEVALNCVGLTIEDVTVNGARAHYDYPVPTAQTTSWFQTGDASEAGDQLVIHAPQPIARGQEFTVTVRYHGAPKIGLYWVQPEEGQPEKRPEVWSQGEGEDNRHWIPCHDYPNDKATFEGKFRVEKGYYVLSNGTLVGQNEVNGKTEFHWRLDQPQTSYLIMIAAARYDIIEDEVEGVKLMYVVPPGTPRETVMRGYGLTPDMLRFFNQTIGIDYPFDKYAQVVVQNFMYGGMENTSATTMNARTLFDERAELTRDVQGLVAHELAHQWWGDMLTCREWSHLWLNEGFATYYQALYHEYHDGDDAFRHGMSRRHQGVTRRDDTNARPMVTDFYNRKDSRNNANVYIKGSSVLHMLRFMLGDEAYHATIKHYGEKHKHTVVETSDLSRAVKDVTGENLDWFFEQWVYLAGHPKFKVSQSWDREAGMLRLEVKQTQKVEGLVPLFRVPLDVEVTCVEKTETYRILVDQDDQAFHFSLPSEPKMVIFDKGDWILKTLDFPKTARELDYQIRNGDYMERVRAAAALAQKGSSDLTVPALRDALLADGHYGLRREAALSLGKVGEDAAREALGQGLGSEVGRVRLACTEALGEFKGDEAAARMLLKLFREDPAYGVRAAAVSSLVKMEAKSASKACREALEQESDRGRVRNAGLNGLVELEETEALGLIVPYTKSGQARTHRHTAIRAYANLAKELEDEGARKDAAEDLSGMLDDWYLRTRSTVIRALGSLGEKSIIPDLRRVQSNDAVESICNLARRTADRIESKKDEQGDMETVKTTIKDLENKIEALQKKLDALSKKVPEKSTTEAATDTATSD